MRYQGALTAARDKLLERIAALTPAQLQLTDEALEGKDPEAQFLVRAARRKVSIARLEIAAVISASHNQDPAFNEWSDPAKVESR